MINTLLFLDAQGFSILFTILGGLAGLALTAYNYYNAKKKAEKEERKEEMLPILQGINDIKEICASNSVDIAMLKGKIDAHEAHSVETRANLAQNQEAITRLEMMFKQAGDNK